jgi:acyl carrier protein
MNNWQTTLLRVKKIVAKQFGTDIENIRDNESLLVVGIGDTDDSLDIVELMLAIEDEFSIEIDDDAIEDLTTLDRVARYLIEVGASENAPTNTKPDPNDVLW